MITFHFSDGPGWRFLERSPSWKTFNFCRWVIFGHAGQVTKMWLNGENCFLHRPLLTLIYSKYVFMINFRGKPNHSSATLVIVHDTQKTPPPRSVLLVPNALYRRLAAAGLWDIRGRRLVHARRWRQRRHPSQEGTAGRGAGHVRQSQVRPLAGEVDVPNRSQSQGPRSVQ